MVEFSLCSASKYLRSGSCYQWTSPHDWARRACADYRGWSRSRPFPCRVDSEAHDRNCACGFLIEFGDLPACSLPSQSTRLAMASEAFESWEIEDGASAASVISRDAGADRDRRIFALWLPPQAINLWTNDRAAGKTSLVRLRVRN